MSDMCDCGHSCDESYFCEECSMTFCEKCWAAHTIDTDELEKAPDGEPMRVELHDAFTWDCDKCGRENLYRCTTQMLDELSGEMEEKLREMLSLEEWQDLPEQATGNLVDVPMVVVCANAECRAKFLTQPPANIEF